MKRDLVTLANLTDADLKSILSLAKRQKAALRAGRPGRPPLAGKTAALIFEKPSLRTRVTFETGLHQLGVQPIYLSGSDIQFGARETVPDIAKNLSRWVDLIVARTYSHGHIVELADNATIPVVNALSDWAHPCQALADFFTISEHRKRLKGLRMAYVGDGNNVVHSLITAAVRLGVDLSIACPKGYEPDARVIASSQGPGSAVVTHSVEEAVTGADVLYTDVWTSMGQEKEAKRRQRAFKGFQINHKVLAQAASDALVMHCLPAHRGEEITAEVLEGPQSVVFDQAENRLHVQKAVITWLFSEPKPSAGSRRNRTLRKAAA